MTTLTHSEGKVCKLHMTFHKLYYYSVIQVTLFTHQAKMVLYLPK